MSTIQRYPDLPAPADRVRQVLPLDFSQITVLFTDLQSTAPAVAVARELGRAVGGEVTVMTVQTSAPQLSDREATASIEDESEQLRRQLRAAGADVRFRVVVSSKTSEALRLMIPRHSLVVMGGRPRWWPTSASRLRRRLEAQGHCVLFVPEVAHAA